MEYGYSCIKIHRKKPRRELVLKRLSLRGRTIYYIFNCEKNLSKF